MDRYAIPNPFVVGRYISPHYFCDRQKDTNFLMKQIDNGRNVALISPRRMGKTGLINHCFQQHSFAERYHTFFVDIYATTSLAELVYLLGKAIYEELKPKGRQWTERFFQVIGSLRMGFKLDAMTGEPSFDIGLGDIQTPQTTLDEIFEYLESAERPCVVAIDEFQQIGNYEEKNVEALLRTKIQQCHNTLFVFAGSERHVMNNMFNSSSKPFYQSAISMGLAPIPLAAPNEVCGTTVLPIAANNVITTQEETYKYLLSNLAPKQKMVLQAIAREGKARNVTSAAFMRKYNLPSASSVQAAIKGLLKNDIITQEDDAYQVYDYFFSTWLAKDY